MKPCSMLYSDINLEPGSLQPCCDVHGCQVPAFPFNGGEVDMRAYATHIANTIRRLQKRTHPSAAAAMCCRKFRIRALST